MSVAVHLLRLGVIFARFADFVVPESRPYRSAELSRMEWRAAYLDGYSPVLGLNRIASGSRNPHTNRFLDYG